MGIKKYDKNFCLGMKVKKHPEFTKLNEEIRELKKINCNILKITLLGISSILMFNFGVMFIFLNSVELRFINFFGFVSFVSLMTVAFILSCLCFYYVRKIENKEEEFFK